MKKKQLLICLFSGSLIFSNNVIAQRVWDVRGLASSPNTTLNLPLTDTSVKTIQRSDAILIREIVDRYSKLSGIYPQIYLESTNSYNANARLDNKTPAITIYMPMFDLFMKDRDIAAAVLGHEMAHLYLGHLEGSKVAEIAGEIAGELIGIVAQVFLESLIQRNLGVSNLGTRIGASLGASLGAAATATYSRSQETDADELGIKWAAESGYDPLGAVRLFLFFEQNGQSTSFSFFNKHPTNADRIQNIRAIASSLKKDAPTFARVERDLKDTPDIISLNNLADQDWLKGTPKSNSALRGIKAFQEGKYSAARKDFEECSSNGELVCLNNLGVIYLNGLGTEKDVHKASNLFKEAGDGGLARAYKNYAASLGSRVYFPKMIEAYSKASEMGSAEAMGTLAYLSLLEVDPESRRAFPPEATLINYAKVSAMRGVASGQLALGTFYRKGLGVQKNLDLAEINLKLAVVSDERADGELYVLYDLDLNNQKLSQDYKKKIFFNKETYAMDVVTSNLCKGAYDKFSSTCTSWIKESAIAGAGASGLIYGILLFDGATAGIKQDRFEGLSWIVASKFNGNKKAADIYELVKPSLSQDEATNINKRALEINSTFPKVQKK